jgi:hypothetical protein
MGTSFAAPHVAGVAALVLSVNESLSPDEVETLLVNTAMDIESPGWDELSGHGRIDAAGAVAAAASAAENHGPFAYSPGAESLPGGIEVRWTTSNERDMSGFRVLRGLAGAGPAPLHANPIAAKQSGVDAGAEYVFLDGSAEAGTEYSYWLEVLSAVGPVERYALGEDVVARWWVHVPLATVGQHM